MTKEEVQHEIEKMLESHNDELMSLLTDCYNATITISNSTINVKVTQNTNSESRKDGIKISHDGASDVFLPVDALLFAIKEIGYQRFHDNQSTQIVSRDKPNDKKDSDVKECADKDGSTWFVFTRSGTDRKISLLNNMFKRLDLDWKAERS